ncbi:MAG: ATP synthase F1 subunit gamma, partial [Micrococcales bacterium]|nr:ATP synthase F1 subunit gamma [Micrococcales bacterium]
TDTNRVLVLVMTADRGMAGAYNASVLREADRLRERLEAEGHTIDLCCTGRRGIGHYQYRGVPLVATWEGWSDAPERPHSREIANTLLRRFLAEAEPKDGSEPGVREIHIVYTRFRSMVVQEPRVIRMLPLEIVEQDASESEELFPLYEFEPSPAEVLDALLPRYIRSRVWNCLLQAAASELAARQSAMHTATENAEDLIRQYTRLANEARQAEITQEISEIVSGVNALASGG